MAEVLLSESERTFILHGVQSNVRSDGRGCEDYRCLELETDVVSNASGSARVRLANTDILVGVKAELGTPKQENPAQGYLEFFVDCSANATPEFEGRGGESLALEISSVLAQAYRNPDSLDLRALSVIPREQCWVLYIDVLLLEVGGNLFDAVSVAVKAALHNTKVPNVQVLAGEAGQTELHLSDDPYDCARLEVTGSPCVITLNKIGNCHVVDATMQEEACSLARLMMGVTEDGCITALRKAGGGSLDPTSLFDMMESGKRVGQALNKMLMTKLAQEEKLGTKRKKTGFLH